MATKIFQQSTINPYQITGRCLNKEWFAVPMPVVWTIMCDYLYFIHHAYDIQIHSFVLMANHFHLLASAPTGQLSRSMQYFMCQTSKVLASEAKRINHIWGTRFYRCEIRTHHYFLNAYKYNYQNPISAGIVRNVEEYRFSTLHGLIGASQLTIPMIEDVTLFSNSERTLKWLNTEINPKHRDDMSKALRRRVFELPKIDSRPHPLEFDLL